MASEKRLHTHLSSLLSVNKYTFSYTYNVCANKIAVF